MNFGISRVNVGKTVFLSRFVSNNVRKVKKVRIIQPKEEICNIMHSHLTRNNGFPFLIRNELKEMYMRMDKQYESRFERKIKQFSNSDAISSRKFQRIFSNFTEQEIMDIGSSIGIRFPDKFYPNRNIIEFEQQQIATNITSSNSSSALNNIEKTNTGSSALRFTNVMLLGIISGIAFVMLMQDDEEINIQVPITPSIPPNIANDIIPIQTIFEIEFPENMHWGKHIRNKLKDSFIFSQIVRRPPSDS